MSTIRGWPWDDIKARLMAEHSPTGRLKQDGPAMHGLAIHTELGEQIRRAFLGERLPLVRADYEKIERRVTDALAATKDSRGKVP